MWDDVIIGSGNKGTSAARVYQIRGPHGISENSVSYWISEVGTLKISMTIMKDTSAGQTLGRMIEAKNSLEEIMEYLEELALPQLLPEVLQRKIQNLKEDAFRDGVESAQFEMRKALGM